MEGEALEGSQLACFKGFCRKRQIPPNYVAQAAQNYKGTGDCIDDRVGGVVYEAVAPDYVYACVAKGGDGVENRDPDAPTPSTKKVPRSTFFTNLTSPDRVFRLKAS